MSYCIPQASYHYKIRLSVFIPVYFFLPVRCQLYALSYRHVLSHVIEKPNSCDNLKSDPLKIQYIH